MWPLGRPSKLKKKTIYGGLRAECEHIYAKTMGRGDAYGLDFANLIINHLQAMRDFKVAAYREYKTELMAEFLKLMEDIGQI